MKHSEKRGEGGEDTWCEATKLEDEAHQSPVRSDDGKDARLQAYLNRVSDSVAHGA